MIATTIATVTVFVEDQARAKAFYTEKLGFALINDAEMFPGAGSCAGSRWRRPAARLSCRSSRWASSGNITGRRWASRSVSRCTATSGSLMATYQEITTMSAKGVQFLGEPQVQPWGSFAVLVDSEGNQIVLGQRA